jgi:hypothetical protein
LCAFENETMIMKDGLVLKCAVDKDGIFILGKKE